jgi:2-polyprenyl-3-methyl-5-hydroxy-6-metoxy-1,4-benzoquinol methylase
MLSKNCAICDSKEFRSVLEITNPDRFEVAVGISNTEYSRFWLECKICGSATNFHTKANLSKIQSLGENYYEVDFGNIHLKSRYDSIMNLPFGKSDNRGRVDRVREMLRDWHDQTGENNKENETKRVLDIGAGLGVFLSCFLDENWVGDAVEPDPNAADHLRLISDGNESFNVHQGIFTGQSEFQDYDLITLNKVVEHVEDPVSLLKSIHAALKNPTGLVYIEVPDKLTIYCRPADDNILGSLHYNLYDPGSLAKLFEVSRFDPIKIGRILEPSGKISCYGFAVSRGNLEHIY